MPVIAWLTVSSSARMEASSPARAREAAAARNGWLPGTAVPALTSA